MRKVMKRLSLFVFSCFLASTCVLAFAEEFVTPVTNKMLDTEGFAEWENGVLKPVVLQRGIAEVLITQTSTTSHRAPNFGVSNRPGTRHLRIPLKEEIPVGTLLIRGLGSVSLLKPGVDPATADPANESLWIPGKRVLEGTVGESGTS